MAPLRTRIAPPLVALALLASPGCGGARGEAPVATLDSFAHALRDQDYEAAYALLSSAYRADVGYEAFVRVARDNPEEVSDLLARVAQTRDGAEITASVRLDEGEALQLVLEDGHWRLVGNVVEFYDQSTPRAAIRSFVRAMERRRYDVVMRFVPRADLEGMSEERMRTAWEGEGREEIERLLEGLRASLDNPIEEVGDRATMAYGQRHTVQLVREDGVWKIEDPD